ncbi:MAG TPA: Holliday junction branch migration protein RuvA [Thermomicrobiales bacterium]|nr:Holliday junction branch migration protein RuvA [Thermomicrobiales bacterium]
MIAGLRGQIGRLEAAAVVVDLHGFMLRVQTSTRVLANLGSPGDPVNFVTHLAVREDALTLYGFPTQAELDLFELLLTVSGVGPKVALALLSFGEPSALYEAIANEDTALLSKVPGIGNKTAEQIVFHLRRKLPDFVPAGTSPTDDADREAVIALEALGYTLAEARSALASVERRGGMTIEERVFNALQRLAQQ